MKFIFRLIGFLVVIIILASALLCYLDGKDLLSGRLERLIRALRPLGKEAWAEVMLFLTDSGIADDAAGLLDAGASYLREGVSPHETDKPGSGAFDTPVPTITPMPTITPEPTATPEATVTPEPTVAPAPTVTPHIVIIG